MNYDFKIEITADMIHGLHLKGNHLMVFALIDHFTKVCGKCHFQSKEIADMLNLNITTVYTCIKSLYVINHYIEIEKVLTSDGHTLQNIKTIV